MPENAVDIWDTIAEQAGRRDAHLYARFAEGIKEDAGLRELAANAKAGQPGPFMLLAAVHFLLLRGAQHPLRQFYPDLNGGTKVAGQDPFPAFKNFAETHRDALVSLIASRVTNTNEVGRAGFLHAGFRVVAQEAGEPLHLIEIGPSAGLNLVWDRYGVRYVRQQDAISVETPDPVLVIDMELRGDKVPPLGGAPRVASRVGLELNPVDLGDPESRDWLRALVWPDHLDRLARLDAALAAFADVNPEIRGGNALELLADALGDVPEDQPVCVYHTLVTYQFSEAMRETLDDILKVAGSRRPVWRLSLESAPEGGTPLMLSRYHKGTCDSRVLAHGDGHGVSIEWLG